jgi:hypothetical protein
MSLCYRTTKPCITFQTIFVDPEGFFLDADPDPTLIPDPNLIPDATLFIDQGLEGEKI